MDEAEELQATTPRNLHRNFISRDVEKNCLRLQSVISEHKLVGRNTYLPLAEECLDGMRDAATAA